MRLFRYIAISIAFFTSCTVQSVREDVLYSGQHDVLFKVGFEDFDPATKNAGDGTKVDRLLVHAYDNDGNFSEHEFHVEDCHVAGEVSIPLQYGSVHELYFWAYDSEAEVYETGPQGLKGGVYVTYPDEGLEHDSLEILDAFHAVMSVDLSENEYSVVLTRPFAQVNIAASRKDLLDSRASEVVFTTNVAVSFVPGGDIVEQALKSFVFRSEDHFQTCELAGDETLACLGTVYMIVPPGPVVADIVLKDENGVPLKSLTEVSVPLVSNGRTNLIYKGLDYAWKAELCDSPEDVPSEKDPDGYICISRAEELAAFLIFGGKEGEKYRVCNDIDMSRMPAETAGRIGGTFKDICLEGGGNSVRELNDVPAFLGQACGITIRNLVLDGISVRSSGNAGVLVNDLRGGARFENVTVRNSSASGVGASGGLVGYIARKNERDRSETYKVLFTDCVINSVTVSGDGAEGEFVGLFSGYDQGETLVFASGCASGQGTRTDGWFSCYVEGNEGEWLSANDYSDYDGFLGAQTYHRGRVYFGGEDEQTNRFVPKWDGAVNAYKARTVEPLKADLECDGVESGYVVYSAADLAYFQGGTYKTVEESVTFMSDVDLGSHDFEPIYQLNHLDGTGHTLHNLRVVLTGRGVGAGLISMAMGTTVHANLTFSNAYVSCTPTESSPNGYAGVLCSYAQPSDYTVRNVTVKNSSLYGINKMGCLIGFITLDANKFTCSNCHVKDCYIENNRSDLDSTDKFEEQGEVGGLIGYIACKSGLIENCSVTGTEINGKTSTARHVNHFIGDIVLSYSDRTISINGCSATGNTGSKSNQHHLAGGIYTTSTTMYIIVKEKGTLYIDGVSVAVKAVGLCP